MPLAPNPLNAYPNTGLAQLGDTLLRGSGDYANIRLRDQHEAQRRAQQLADLQGARQFATEQFDKQRALQVSDRDLARKLQLEDRDAAELRQEQLATAQQTQARIRELVALGFLAEADVMDEAKIIAADAAATARTSLLRIESDAADKEAKVYVNDLAQQAKDVQTEMKDIQNKLAAIPDTPTPPTPKEIDTRGRALAARAKQDYANAGIRAEYQAVAAEELAKDSQMRLFFAQQKAETYRQMLTGSRYRLEAINSQLTDFARRKILPTVKPPTGVSMLSVGESAEGEESYAPQQVLAAPQAAGLREAPSGVKISAAGGANTPNVQPGPQPGTGGLAQPQPAATPAAGYGGLFGALGGAGRAIGSAASGAGRLASDIAQFAPGTIEMALGGQKLFEEGEAGRAAMPPLQPETGSMGTLLAPVGIYAETKNRAAEDQVLAKAPNSLQAIEIRRRRAAQGLAQPTPALKPLAPTVPAGVFSYPDPYRTGQ